jgi:hypothetical protein
VPNKPVLLTGAARPQQTARAFEIVDVKKATRSARFVAARPRFTASARERAFGN